MDLKSKCHQCQESIAEHILTNLQVDEVQEAHQRAKIRIESDSQSSVHPLVVSYDQ